MIGLFKAKGATGFCSSDDNVIIPFGTSCYRLFKTDRVDDIFALASSDDRHWSDLDRARLCVATLVGLLFGVRPARRASSLDPIEALRFE